MSAQLRTVRLLSREPGEPSETRMVEGVQVEKGVPMPQAFHNGLLRVIASLEVGESFVWKCAPSFHRKAMLPKEFATKHVGPKQYRVWRTK